MTTRNHKLIGIMICVCAALLAAGCGSSRTTPAADAGGDAVLGSDATGPTTWSFSAEDDGSALKAASLELDGISGDEAWLKVTVRGVSKLQGIAFRLKFDPQAVSVEESEIGPAWATSDFPDDVVSRFATRSEGELWAGIGFEGLLGLPASKEQVVARVKVKLSGSKPLQVAFRPHHNLVLDTKGQGVEVKWLGGTFQPKAK
jgi:hypothetical protein